MARAGARCSSGTPRPGCRSRSGETTSVRPFPTRRSSDLMIAEPDSVGSRAAGALARDHGEGWRKVLERNAAAWLQIKIGRDHVRTPFPYTTLFGSDDCRTGQRGEPRGGRSGSRSWRGLAQGARAERRGMAADQDRERPRPYALSLHDALRI